jgi:hypothetical protein
MVNAMLFMLVLGGLGLAVLCPESCTGPLRRRAA